MAAAKSSSIEDKKEQEDIEIDKLSINKNKFDDGDFVAYYPKLIGAFVVLQVVKWVFGILEVLKVIGPVGYTVMTATLTFDVALCQMMYLGTLHYYEERRRTSTRSAIINAQYSLYFYFQNSNKNKNNKYPRKMINDASAWPWRSRSCCE